MAFEDLRGDVFTNVPALGRPPDHASDCVPDRIVPAQEIGESFEITTGPFIGPPLPLRVPLAGLCFTS